MIPILSFYILCMITLVSIMHILLSIIGAIAYLIEDSIRNGKKNTIANIAISYTNIKKGEVFTGANITVKRANKGISPMLWDSLIGQYATKNYSKDQLI